MKKLRLILILASLLMCGSILVACDADTQVVANPKGYSVDYAESNGTIYKNISNLTAYIRDLAMTKSYDEVETEMTALCVSREDYENSAEITFGKEACVALTNMSSDEEQGESVATSQNAIESFAGLAKMPNDVMIISSIAKTQGANQELFKVAYNIYFSDEYQPSEYTDLIGVMGDRDMYPVAESMSADYESNNCGLVYCEDAEGNTDVADRIPLFYNMDTRTLTCPLETSKYPGISFIAIRCEFSGDESSFLSHKVPQYFAFTLSYAKAQKNISLDSLGISLGVSVGGDGLSAFPGVSFSFSQKESFDTWSTTIGTWAYDGTYPVTEGAVYRIKSNKNTGLLGLLNRWMQVSKTSTEAGTTINTDSGTFKTGQYFTFVPHIDGTVLTYEILPNHIMGYCISSANGQVTMQPRDDSNAQRFRIEESGSSYVIKTYDGTKCLGFNDDDVVQLETYTGASDQLWTFRYEYDANSPMEYAEYVLSNVGSDLYMDVSESSTANGAALIQYERRAEPNQKFMLVYVGDGEYSLIPVMATSKRVTVDTSNSNGEGAAVYLWDANGSDNQRFKLVRGNNGFKLLTASSDFTKALGVVEDAMDGGVAIQQLTSTSSFIYWKFA